MNFTEDGILTEIKPALSYSWGTVLIIAIILFTVCLAILFNKINKLVNNEHQINSLDLAFDAGGQVSMGLTASTIVSQWTWSATLLQSSTVAIRYGISGPFWYAAGATVQILLFSIISIKLKTLAPGAKTFTQFVRWRFGLGAHKVYCFYALLTNVIVTSMLMIGAAQVITVLIGDYSLEMTILMLTAAIGGYTMIGGLGATFYASYFNTATVFIGILIFVYVVFLGGNQSDIGSMTEIYDKISAMVGPEGNRNSSYLTIFSKGGAMFGVINLIGNFGTVFMDQAYWQSSVAAQPKDGVLGFLMAGLVWFAVPFTFATTISMAYLAVQSQSDIPLLADEQINAGFVPIYVASYLGPVYGVVLLVMILMAATSTGSAEIIAVGSIIIYDIYMVYVKPFRSSRTSNACTLCGKSRGRMANQLDKCSCVLASHCSQCALDRDTREATSRVLKPEYRCRVHGKYKAYEDIIHEKKNWCLLLTTISIVPMSLALNRMGLSLGWIYLFMGILIGSSVVPVSLSMFLNSISSNAMIISPISGTFLGIIAWISVSSQYENGLHDFLKNTGRDEPMLAGNLVSILTGGLVCILVSAVEGGKMSWSDRMEQWHSTLDIDNPLYPWAEIYRKQQKIDSATHEYLDDRPPLAELEASFKTSKRIAMGVALALSLVILIVIPGVSLLPGVFSKTTFIVWITVAVVWALIGGATIIIVPLFSEIYYLRKDYIQNKQISPMDPISGSREFIFNPNDDMETPTTPFGNEFTMQRFSVEELL